MSGWDVKKSQESCTVPVSATGQHFPSGTWLTTNEHFNSCPSHVHWRERILFVYKNLRFIEFVAGTLMPQVHLTQPTACTEI